MTVFIFLFFTDLLVKLAKDKFGAIQTEYQKVRAWLCGDEMTVFCTFHPLFCLVFYRSIPQTSASVILYEWYILKYVKYEDFFYLFIAVFCWLETFFCYGLKTETKFKNVNGFWVNYSRYYVLPGDLNTPNECKSPTNCVATMCSSVDLHVCFESFKLSFCFISSRFCFCGFALSFDAALPVSSACLLHVVWLPSAREHSADPSGKVCTLDLQSNPPTPVWPQPSMCHVSH